MNSCSTKCRKRAKLLLEGTNAANKKYHHHLGSGGYMSDIPKRERMEQEMIARG
jgi:hypothetical protein